MKGVILAAGYAKDFEDSANAKPKHLQLLNDCPVIEFLMEHLEKLAIDHYFLVTNNRFAQDFQEWAQNSKWAGRITIVNDHTTSRDDQLGSVGDLLYVIQSQHIDDDCFVIGANHITDFHFSKMLELFVNKRTPIIGAIECNNLDEAKHKGQLEVDSQGRILAFIEKGQNPKSCLISTLYYMIPKEFIPYVKVVGKQGKDAKAGKLIEELIAHTPIYTYTHNGYWIDITKKENYEKAKKMFS